MRGFLRYFTGVAWGATERLVAMLLPIAGEPIFICPGFELGSFEASLSIPAPDIRLWEEDESPSALVADALKAAGPGRSRSTLPWRSSSSSVSAPPRRVSR